MKKKLISLAMYCALLFVVVSSASAQEKENEYQKVVNEFLEVSGSMNTLKKAVPQVLNIYKKDIQNLPEEAATFFDTFAKKWDTKFVDRAIELLIPIYQKYFTLEELKEVIAFYRTPIGKKMASAATAMAADGAKIGQQVTMEMIKELKEEVLNKK